MRWSPFLMAPAFLALACSTTSIYQSPNSVQRPAPPPEPERLPTAAEAYEAATEARLAKATDAADGQVPEATLWWTRYSQAKAWAGESSDRACALFAEAASFERFPLRKLARLRAIEHCPAGKVDGRGPATLLPASTWQEALDLGDEPWLREIALRAALARAIADRALEGEMKVSSDLAREERLSSRKVALLSRAIEIARTLSDAKSEVPALQRRLLKIAPRFTQKPKPSEWLAVAKDFRVARDFAASHEFYRKVLTGRFSDEEKLKALDGIRQAFKLERKMEDWTRETRERAQFARARMKASRGKWIDLYHDAQLDLARVLWTQVSAAEATRALDDLSRDLNGARPLDEALWIRARIAEEAGDFKNAVALLTKAQTGPMRAGPTVRLKIKWYHAWNLAKTGALAEAASELDALAEMEPGGSNGLRDRFWSAKWRAQLGEKEKATSLWEKIVEDDPLGYYGLVSQRELGRKLPSLATKSTPPSGAADATSSTSNGPFSNGDDRNTLEWLISVGELEGARRFIATKATRPEADDEEGARELLRAYARAGSYAALFERLASLDPDLRARLLDEDASLLFPRPSSIRTLVDAAAESSGVQAEFIYSIMRQESSFDPEARSHADAFGLMQLIPTVAEHANASAKTDYSKPEDLFRPDVNIPLGATFLRELLDRWGGQMPLAAASYNASERAIQGWLQTRYRGDALAFIEEIPYDETRGYVKLVARNFVFYSRLAAAGKDIDFPEKAIAITATNAIRAASK